MGFTPQIKVSKGGNYWLNDGLWSVKIKLQALIYSPKIVTGYYTYNNQHLNLQPQ